VIAPASEIDGAGHEWPLPFSDGACQSIAQLGGEAGIPDHE
jgi:hypothetical protein